MPGLFTHDGSGRGQAAILNEDGTINSVLKPAPCGSIVALFGTGGDLTDPLFGDGQIATAAAPTVVHGLRTFIGNQFVRADYRGAAPGLVNGAIQVKYYNRSCLTRNRASGPPSASVPL
jgi:uncharacterized protein (TIGR03437 family)